MTAKSTTQKKSKSPSTQTLTTKGEQTNGQRKTSRKRPAKTANELMREAWEYTYANRDRRLDR